MRRDEENEENGENMRETADEEAPEVPGNGWKSEHLEHLECFHYLRLEAQWPCVYCASLVIRDDVHVFPPAG